MYIPTTVWIIFKSTYTILLRKTNIVMFCKAATYLNLTIVKAGCVLQNGQLMVHYDKQNLAVFCKGQLRNLTRVEYGCVLLNGHLQIFYDKSLESGCDLQSGQLNDFTRVKSFCAFQSGQLMNIIRVEYGCVLQSSQLSKSYQSRICLFFCRAAS